MINESDFILNHKKFNNRLDNLYWKNHPGWELKFKKFDDEEFKEVDQYYGCFTGIHASMQFYSNSLLSIPNIVL